MKNEPRSRLDGGTMDDYVAGYVHEAIDDEIGVSLASIVSDGRRSFGLEGDDLVAYVRRGVAALAAIGARPEHWEMYSRPGHLDGPVHFGADTPEEIVEGVLADWIAEGMPDLGWGDYRFITAEGRAYLDEVVESKRREAAASDDQG